MTERVGLLGWPVGHSISAAMHNAAFAALGLDWHYDAIPVPPEQFAAEVERLIRTEGYRGFNVTIPHKRAALRLRLLADVTPAVAAIGAANTLIRTPEDTWIADNTDWHGFMQDLAAHGVTIDGATCLVLGTGGSAVAIGYALVQGGAEAVIPISRDPSAHPGAHGYEDLAALAPTAKLIVNCTPLGMAPNTYSTPWPEEVPFPPNAVLYDLVYNPPVTQLMQQAGAAGARALGGLGMLVAQGALAFEHWTGLTPPLDVMAGAARAALEQLSPQR